MNGKNVQSGHMILAALLAVLLLVFWPAFLQAQNAPVLRSPENGAMDVVEDPVLYWNPGDAQNIINYVIQIDDNSDFSSIVYTTNTSATDVGISSGTLSYYKIYYWRVYYNYYLAGRGASPWSETWQFTTRPPKPATPALLAPEAAALDVQIDNLLLKWESSDYPSSANSPSWEWQLQVDDNSDFTTPIVNDKMKDRQKSISGLARNTKYYWQVNAINASGNTWSATWWFVTIPNVPAAPGLISPKDGSVDCVLSPELIWEAISGCDSYRISIGPCSDPGSATTYISTTASYTIPIELEKATEYCWKVQAHNAGGWGAWSESWTLETLGDMTLSLTKAGSGDGHVKVNSSSRVLPHSERALKGTSYHLTALPATGSVFAGWSGDITSTALSIDVVLDSDKNITLTFNLPLTEHSVTTPGTPSGPSSGTIGEMLTFTGGGSTCSNGDAVQYRYDFGDGVISGWGTAGATHAYSAAGTYAVKAQARCAVSTDHVSVWSGGKSVTITGSSGGGVPIYPYYSTTQVGSSGDLTIEVKVGSATAPVQNLFGLSFTLIYTPTNYLDVALPTSSSIIAGAFMGTDLIFFQNLDDANGRIDVGISRKAGAGNVSGTGTVLNVKFAIANNPPALTSLNFFITNIAANDVAGNPITLTQQTLTLTVTPGARVWPGDNNNDGTVTQADVLPLGIYWGMTGIKRINPAISWAEQLCTFWATRNATFADGNGDGKIDQADVLPIGLNWAKTHTVIPKAEMPPPALAKAGVIPTLQVMVVGSTTPDQDFYIDVMINEVSDLFGLSFDLIYSPAAIIDPKLVETGLNNLMGDDLIFFPMINKNAGIDSGRISAGISRKAGQGSVSGTGLVAHITAHMSATAVENLSHSFFTLTNIQANDAAGNPIKIDSTAYNLVSETAAAAVLAPANFGLYENYPNPFNPVTTIAYEIPANAEVTLSIYGVSGQLVRQLVNEPQCSGRHSVIWDGRNTEGALVPSGIYICSLRSGSLHSARRLSLLK